MAGALQFFTSPAFGWAHPRLACAAPVHAAPSRRALSDRHGRRPFLLLSVGGLAAQMFMLATTVTRSTVVIATVIRGLVASAVLARLSAA